MGQLEALFLGQRGGLFLMGKSGGEVVYNQPINSKNEFIVFGSRLFFWRTEENAREAGIKGG